MTTPASSPAPEQLPEPDPQTDWQAWHAEREETLREPNGWLSLVSLTWLDAAPQAIAGFPGLWSARGSALPSAEGENWEAQVLLSPDSGVTRDGAPVSGTVTISLATGGSDSSLMCDGVVAEVAQRGSALMVRIRDPKAATRTRFQGVPTYDFSPEWMRPARFTPDAETREFTVPSAQPGLTTRITRVGRVAVSLPDGTVVDLLATGSPQSPSVIFHDPTNGDQTAAWRAAPVVLPSVPDSTGEGVPAPSGVASRGTTAAATSGAQALDGPWDVLVDFNRSTNFPAHFTAYGTCPTPPEGNNIPLPVTAGEKKPTPPAED